MNPLILFDYIFYRIAYFYENIFGEEEQNELAGFAILSLIQFANILVLLDLIGLKESLIKSFHIFVFIIGYLLMFLLNYIRYNRLIEFNDLEEKWGEEKPKVKHTRSVLIIVYFLLSFYLLAP